MYRRIEPLHVAEALQEVRGDAAVVAEALGEGSFTGPVHVEALEAGDVEQVASGFDNERVAQLARSFEFFSVARVVVGFECEPEDLVVLGLRGGLAARDQ